MDGQAAMERRIVSVLFADLVGFTALSERLDAEDVAATQDAYFAIVRETVGRHGGVLEKFIGDAAMAVFGVPRTREDDAERAVRAGLALAAAVDALGPRLGMEDASLQVRVGVTTGEVALAVAGPDAGRVTGDVVNVAARLQAAAPVGGVLMSEATALAVADTIETGPTTGIELKGKAEPVRSAVAVGPLPARSRERAMGALHAELVGRDAELRWFRDVVAAVPAGASRTALIVAPPGTGKSRFVADACAAALRDGTVDAVWTARNRPAGAPYAALREICRVALPELPAGAIDPARLTEHLAAVGGLTPARAAVVAEALAALVTTGQPVVGSTTSVADWLGGLDALGGGSCAVWVVEDLHWGGTDLLAALATLDNRPIPNGGRRLVLGTARPGPLALPDSLPAAQRLELMPLEPGAAQELVRALVGDALPDSVVAQVGTRSEGNALFVEELLRTWVATGTLVAQPDGAWRLAVPDAIVSVPTTVQAVYAAQIDDLAPDARTALRRASVAGRRFPVDALTNLDVPDPQPAVGRLVRSGAVTGPVPVDLVGDVYAYRHALLRDAAYASLARAERARLHVALARWLIAIAGDRANDAAAQIGGHFAAALEVAPGMARMLAVDLDRDGAARLAAEWLERAGDQALAGSAPRAARELYEQATGFARGDEPLSRARLVCHLGIATALSADLDQAQLLFQEAMDLFRPLLAGPDRSLARDGLAEAGDELAKARYEQIRFADAAELAKQTLAEIGEPVAAGPDLASARLRMRAAISDHAATDADTSDILLEVVAISRAAGDRQLELKAMTLASLVRLEVGLPDPFGWESTAALARELGAWGVVIDHLMDRALILADDHPARAFPLLDEAQELADERGLTEHAAVIDYIRSEALAVTGDLEATVQATERAIAFAERNAFLRLAVRSYHVLVPVAAARGDHGPALRLEAFYAAREGAFPDSGYARVMRGAMDTYIADAHGRPVEPPELEPRLAGLSQGFANPSLVLGVERLIEVWIRSGRLADARKALDQVRSAPVNPEATDLGRAAVRLLAARIAAADGHAGEAEAGARAALAACLAIPAPWFAAKALSVLADAGRATAAERRDLAALKGRLGLV